MYEESTWPIIDKKLYIVKECLNLLIDFHDIVTF